MSDFSLFPPQASTTAPGVDALYFFLVSMSAFFSLLIASLLLFFAVRYRRRRGSGAVAPQPPHTDLAHGRGAFWLEITWTAIPLAIVLFVFSWGASLYFHNSRPPDDAMNVLVVGKRWMWKLQHLNGKREINELHVPVGRAVRLTMTSEDVIHSFFIPAFRIKADVIPGRYATTWFQATRPGRYHLFCAEYCGTKHSEMGGWVHVMEPAAFETWLAGSPPGQPTAAAAGERLFGSLGCASCHRQDSKERGPALDGVYGRTVVLQNGDRVTADEAYLRESILSPGAKVVAGYPPVMPTFRGLVTEEGILELIAYMKSRTSEGAALEERRKP